MHREFDLIRRRLQTRRAAGEERVRCCGHANPPRLRPVLLPQHPCFNPTADPSLDGTPRLLLLEPASVMKEGNFSGRSSG